MRKSIMLALATIALAGCSGGDDAVQQAEIERLQAETERLRAEAEQVRSQNAQQAALAAVSYGQASRCALLARYFRDEDAAAFNSHMAGSGYTAENLTGFLGRTISTALNAANTKAETMDPRPDVARETGAAAVLDLRTEGYLASKAGNNAFAANLLTEFSDVCRPFWDSAKS